jgi:hypothetical protein
MTWYCHSMWCTASCVVDVSLALYCTIRNYRSVTVLPNDSFLAEEIFVPAWKAMRWRAPGLTRVLFSEALDSQPYCQKHWPVISFPWTYLSDSNRLSSVDQQSDCVRDPVPSRFQIPTNSVAQLACRKNQNWKKKLIVQRWCSTIDDICFKKIIWSPN